MFVSARTGEGIDELESRIELFLNSLDAHVTVEIPYTRGELVSRVHEHGTVLREEYTDAGTVLEARMPTELAASLSEFAVEEDVEE